jgi:hypothetical protein
MWCCKACGHQMHVARRVPDVTAMAPGYEYRLYECPGGHAKRWRLVFNGPLMADNIGLPRTPSHLRVWAAKTAVAAGELWTRSAETVSNLRARSAGTLTNLWARSAITLTGIVSLFRTTIVRRLMHTAYQVRDTLFRDLTLLHRKIVSFLADAFDRRPQPRAAGALKPAASLEGRGLPLIAILRRAAQSAESSRMRPEHQSTQLRDAVRPSPVAVSNPDFGARERSPQMPANRKPATPQRPAAAQVSEATFLLRRLARVHRRELSPAVRS